MQKFIILFHLLSFFTLLNSQNLSLEGELTSCHASLKHVEFKFLQFETGINVLDPVYKLKEQAYIQQCEEASHPLCAPHGPNHLANKINSMGMAGFEKWKLQNPKEWFVIATTCGLKP